MNQSSSVFAQIVQLLPRKAFDNAVRRYRGQRRVRSLSCMDQLLCVVFAQLTGVYVLVVRLTHRFQLSQELNELLQVLGLSLSEKNACFRAVFANARPGFRQG